jgi:hypothetical protein
MFSLHIYIYIYIYIYIGKLGLTSTKPRCLLGLVMYQGRHLDLTVNQFQGNVGLSNMPDPRHLNLIFRQVQNR